MVDRRRIISVLLVAGFATMTARADMAPVSPPQSVTCPGESVDPASADASCLAPAADRASLPAFLPSYVLAFSPSGSIGSLPVGFTPEREPEGGQVYGIEPVQVLADHQGSLALCLYGLLGFGAFRSLSCVKRLSLGFLPDWYHAGGPLQVGHSFAITPDCLGSAPVCCFVQPDNDVRDDQLQYRGRILASLWRVSQFTPAVLAARGPPGRSKQIDCLPHAGAWYGAALSPPPGGKVSILVREQSSQGGLMKQASYSPGIS